LRGLTLSLVLASLVSAHSVANARDAYASWDNRCEECHGDADEFARKYLWEVDGRLQGRHHVDDLHLFMPNHYTPPHEIEKMTAMLQAQANKMARFQDECGTCHGNAEDFVRASISTWGDGLTGVKTDLPIARYLQSHQQLDADGAEFFSRLIARVIDQI
jgi:cytochrome c553